MEIRFSVDEKNVMECEEVMKKIAEAQNWTITVQPDYWAGDNFRFVTKDGRGGTYDVCNDEIEWDDDTTGSLFGEFDGNKDYRGETFNEFFDFTMSVWGTTGDTQLDERSVLYFEG